MQSSDEPEQRQFVCSGCYEIVPESLIRILPHFNEQVASYVTTYRCEDCWPQAVANTRARVARAEDWADILSLIDCLERHSLFLLEFRRGDPFPVVRALLEQVIEKLADGDIRLSAGPLA